MLQHPSGSQGWAAGTALELLVWPRAFAVVLWPRAFAVQTINDWYDRDIDAINEPYRPIPSGRRRSLLCSLACCPAVRASAAPLAC